MTEPKRDRNAEICDLWEAGARHFRQELIDDDWYRLSRERIVAK